ncbi:carbon-nitrogen hydrolase family protein [Thalassospira lohafexi]|uniref:Carbon-nitrogen hydrolase family protein n=1 Tax=Thalassospira lohafexi TaxID=744227 RepID=A0A2N3L8U9_9PROT|nr:carbon-nitrogen hydrolase family protein [Thalassospira lohafexi]
MKLAVAQTRVSRDISENGVAIRRAMKSAAHQGARVINFCEGALSGYAKSQIDRPDDWATFDWEQQESELAEIAKLSGELGIFAVVGAAHCHTDSDLPHNSLYIFDDNGAHLARYDKRFLSNTELDGWYVSGTKPVTFDVDGYRFGCAICIECQFPEVFREYEQVGADAVLFSSYGLGAFFDIALQAHAGFNCMWMSVATPMQSADAGAAGIIGPDGGWITRCVGPNSADMDLVITRLDRDDPVFDVPLNKARPWRAKARVGKIYRDNRGF